ncbi:MAG: RNA-binding protein [Halieaceae bacterium]|jgi:ribosome-associated heat shock protein Hsp15|nr:RNA-binding protein [Halieaceae bacterium]
MTDNTPKPGKLRLDKWLWAARFFKTRSLAKAAIDGGKVHLGGQRVKVSKEINVGDTLQIRRGWDELVVEVCALSAQRRGASEAQQLYRETEASVKKRESEAVARKAAGEVGQRPVQRPTKKQRRQIHQFKNAGS